MEFQATSERPKITKQVLWLTAISLVFAGPYLLMYGTGPVTRTYEVAARLFWEKKTPYLAPTWDWFKYAPIFAFFYTPFSWLPSSPQALAWGAFNAAIYWYGLSRWFLFSRSTRPLLWFALVLCSMELDGTLRYQQTNALLIGITLVGLAALREQRDGWAAAILTAASNLKIIPGVFLVILPFRRAVGWGVLFAVLFCVSAPLLYLGPTLTFEWHLQWANLLIKDIFSEGLLDIESVLGRQGFPGFGRFVRSSVFLATMAWVAANRRALFTYSGIALLLTMVTLVSPRTESATFVFVAPAFLFLASEIETLQGWARRVSVAAFVVSAFFVSISFNDIWPKVLFNPKLYYYATKTGGIFLLWGLSFALLTRQVFFVRRLTPERRTQMPALAMSEANST